jgi:hypothetical protein
LRKLLGQITEEREGATAEAARLREHANAVAESAEHIGAESETLRALAELQAQISDKTVKGEARGTEALRAAIATVLEVVYVKSWRPGLQSIRSIWNRKSAKSFWRTSPGPHWLSPG